MSQEFRLENINDTRKYFHEEIEQNKLMNNNQRNVCTNLNLI